MLTKRKLTFLKGCAQSESVCIFLCVDGRPKETWHAWQKSYMRDKEGLRPDSPCGEAAAFLPFSFISLIFITFSQKFI